MVIEELKQRITAKAAKMKRYKGRINQFRQNKLFRNNQKRLFEELGGNKRSLFLEFLLERISFVCIR